MGALDELHQSQEAELEASATQQRALNARLLTSACLLYLKRVYKKVWLKEFCLVKQGLYKLESKEKGSSLKDPETILHSPVVGSLTTLRSPLADSFFNPSFSLLPDLISSNTP